MARLESRLEELRTRSQQLEQENTQLRSEAAQLRWGTGTVWGNRLAFFEKYVSALNPS